ncbi:GABBR2 (predicted) [Pycnogonum litorale]
MKSLFDMVFNTPTKVILFGDACTTVTDPIAKTAKVWHLAQLSYADTHPMFVKDKFPNFYRVVPSENEFNPARLKLLKHFNWTRVGILYQNEPRYELPSSKLVSDLDEAGIEIAIQVGLVGEMTDQVDKMKDTDVRIILGTFDEDWARRVFCRAYKIGMYGRKYQWILRSIYSKRWWMYRGASGITCTPSQMSQVLQGYIAAELLPLETSGNKTVSSLTSRDYKRMYDRTRKGNYSRFHGYAYDGIWAIALTIRLVQQKLVDGNWSVADEKLDNFEYRSPFWGGIFSEALQEINFNGVTGPVSFTDNQRKGYILLKQFQNGTEVKVGEYDSNTNKLDLNKGHDITWGRSRVPPMDRTLVVIEPSRVSLTIYSALATLACCGIVLAFVFLVINIHNRNERYIKMSSPYLNNLIIIGCILTYTSVILLGLDSSLANVNNFAYICAARAWVLMSGFTLAFGSMFSKTWRVHTIFTDIKLNKKVIKDYQLFFIVGVLLMVDIVILTAWQIFDPFYRETTQLQPLESSSSSDEVKIIPEIEACRSDYMTIFLGSIYAYKGLLMIFGCFLAWETRHVSIPALNDSKYVGMSVYNVVIMCSTGAAISFVLKDQQDASFIIISIFIIFCTTGTLCLVFVPKLVELKRSPGSGDRRIRATLKAARKAHRNSDDNGLSKKIRDLQQDISRNKRILDQKELEVRKLLEQLSCDKRGGDRRRTLPTLTEADSSGGGGGSVEVPILHIRPPQYSNEDESDDLLGSSSQSKGSFTYTTAITQSPPPSDSFGNRSSKQEMIPLLKITSPSSKKRNEEKDPQQPRDDDKADKAKEAGDDQQSFVNQVHQIGRNSEDDDDSDNEFDVVGYRRHNNTPVIIRTPVTSTSPTDRNRAPTPPPPYSSLPLGDVIKLASMNDYKLYSSDAESTRGPPYDSDTGSYVRAVRNSQGQAIRHPYDSDTGSYTRAMRESYLNGTVSDTAEESSTTECGNYNSSHSEATADSPPGCLEGRRRAKSVGALRYACDRDSSNVLSDNHVESRRTSCDPRTVSFIDTKKVPRQHRILPPIFPYMDELVRLSDPTNLDRNVRQGQSVRGQQQINHSYPSIKCDIVEYL